MNASPNNRRRWPLGLVSNCWKTQLDAGAELDSLIAEAEQRGLSVIELRQTCVGIYEDEPTFIPNAARLSELSNRFPGVQFNIALSLPCLSGGLSSDDPMFVAGRNAAVALAGPHEPHLRLVDLQTRSDQCTAESVDRSASCLVEQTHSLREIGGILSVEHAHQPWSWFCSVISAARQRLGKESSRLQICFDPCNLLLTESTDDVERIVETVEPQEISMIHLKQRRDGQIQPDVADGDLDWVSLMNVISQREYTGPILFEVAPHADVWSNLSDVMNRYFKC